MLTLREISKKYQISYQSQAYYKRPYNALATPIIKLLLYTNITANQVTMIWVILGSLSTLLFIFGNYWLTLFAFLVFHFHLILDSVDGPIARIKNIKSSTGIYIERIAHDLIFVMFFFCIALGAQRRGLMPNYILVFGFSSAVGYFFYKYAKRAKIYTVLLHDYKTKTKNKNSGYNQQELHHIDRLQETNIKKTKMSFLRSFYLSTQIIWEAVPCILICNVLALFNLLQYAVVFYALTYPIQFLVTYVYQAKIGEEWVYHWLENYWAEN